MLRALVVLLLLANALFYAWAKDWLAPLWPARVDQREPERLAAQINPELITVLTPKAASAALAAVATAASESGPREPAALVCLEAGPFTEAGAAAAETALAQNSVPDGSVTREQVATAFTWGVVMGRFPDRESMRVKADELRRLGVPFDELLAPASLTPGLRLGNFSDRYGAEAALNRLSQKGVRTARVAELPSGPVQHWLRAARADAELQTRLKALPPEQLGAGFRPCAPAR
jgi:hypothetical protein